MSAAAPTGLFKPGSKRTGPLSLLCEATYKGKLADRITRIKELIAAGADVNGLCYPESSGSQTALRLAISSDKPEILKLFLEAGAKITAKDLEESIDWHTPSLKQEVSIMLIDAGAPITIKALNGAIIKGKERVVKRLLEAGANPNEVEDSFTPFARAFMALDADSYYSPLTEKERRSREQILDLLISAGADLKGNIAMGGRNALGLTLDYCPQYLEKILKAGASKTINAPSVDGYPLAIAASDENWDAVKTLLQYGANPHLIPAGALDPEEMERVISEAAHHRRRHATAAWSKLPTISAARKGATALKNTTVKSKRKTVARSKAASRRNRK